MAPDDLNDDEFERRQREFLDHLRLHGPRMGNYRLQRELGWTDELYDKIRNRLLDAGQLRAGPGMGGTVALVVRPTVGVQEEQPTGTPSTSAVPPPTGGAAPIATQRIAEDDLYEPIAQVLRTDWARVNRFREFLVEITARQGRRETGGKWTRPDLTVVSSTTLLYYPTKLFEVTTFEVKPCDNFDVTAVYEALAHRRAATRAYLLIHLPIAEQEKEPATSLIPQICSEAERHGIGVFVVSEPGNYETWVPKVEAARQEPDPRLLHEFLAIQLSETAKAEVVAWFR